MQTAQTDHMCSKEEREVMLRMMRDASAAFYWAAVRIQCHPFIEFTGLINEYIKICQRAHDNGYDFTACSVHSGYALPMEKYEAKYLGEKLGCIYGPSMQVPENLKALLEEMGVRL